MAYEISLDVFQGPLDVLLALIEKGKLEITAVSLATVTDQYLEYMLGMPEPDLDVMCDFLVVAAKLLFIKSRSLLPQPEEPSEAEEDPGRQLVDQLAEYKRFKDAALLLERSAERGRAYPRQNPAPVFVAPVVEQPVSLDGLTLDALAQAMRHALRRRPAAGPTSVVARPRVTLEEKIRLIETVLRAGPTSFDALIEDGDSSYDVVVCFVALLEMYRQCRVMIRQDATFGEIVIEYDPTGEESTSSAE